MKRLIVAACAAALACGAGQTRLAVFSTDWEDDGGASIRRVWERIGAAALPASADVVVGISERADRLVGLSLGRRTKWTYSHRLDARPLVAGHVVVGMGGGELFALDAEAGSVLWVRPGTDGELLGAGDDGRVSVITLQRPGGLGSTLVAVAHDGSLVRQMTTERALGAPAVVEGLAFVPWAGQYVSVIHLESGRETARVTLRTQTSRVLAVGGSLWFGETAFVRFDEHIGDASRGRATTATLPMRELPGMPKWSPPGSVPIAARSTAEDKARLYARPVGQGDGAAIEDGRWYATYFRIAMGFDAGAAKSVNAPSPNRESTPGPTGAGAHRAHNRGDVGGLVWVHLHAADLLGGGAASGGVVLCDEHGKMTELDANNGSVLSEADLGEPLSACVVNVDALRAAGEPRSVLPLAAQLAEAVLADDPQLVVAQRLLLRELAVVKEESATKAIVELASDPRTSPALLADARTALANRRNGESFMEAALARHYDFLRDVLRPPPVGPMAQALGAMRDTAVAPLLAAHLLDPADTDDDVMRTATALSVIAGPSEKAELRQFFGMYRACAADDDIAAAVVSVGQALMMVDPVAGRAIVTAAAGDATTVPYARERLQALLSEMSTNQPRAVETETKGK